MLAPSVVRDIPTLRARLAHARAGGGVVGLVPTMGALHAGHLSLLDAARRDTDFLAVSVFVNPTQFNDPADLAAYPRDFSADLVAIGHAGADLVFAPDSEQMYPSAAPYLSVDPGPLGEVLEGAARPGHFRGVATIVAKLFGLFAPCRAYFGEKDFQQVMIVRAVARELLLPVEIVVRPTVRDPDGLALSSRNTRLTPRERRLAPVLHRALVEGRAVLEAGAPPHEAEALMARVIAEQPAVALEYAVVRDAATLGPPEAGPRRLLLAARIGAVRLIDNVGTRDAAGGEFADGVFDGGQ